MRIAFGALIVSASLMLASVAHANMSSLDSEHFLDPHEQDTLALIASDLAAVGEAERIAALPREPEMIATIERTSAEEVQAEAAVRVPAPEAHDTEVAVAAEAAQENVQVEATGSLPLTPAADTQPSVSASEGDQLALSSPEPVDQTSSTAEMVEIPAASLP
jgi:hypothetical protein